MKNTGYGIGIKKGDLQIREDFLALHQKKHVIWIFFMEQIIIRILEPAAEVWLLTEVMAGRERFIILKIRRSVQNLKKMLIQ